MKNIFTALASLLTLCFSTLSAQSDSDFEAFGKQVFTEVTDTTNLLKTRFIRPKEYHALIDVEPLNDHQKSLLKQKINEDYSNMYVAYQNAVKRLTDSYYLDAKEGATFEYLQTRSEILEGSKNTYAVQTTFLYKNKKVQSRVRLNYNAGWLGEELVLISPVKEVF